ncbi:MAG: HNH endonuclease [Halobacteriaceae archaeon]
MSVQEDREKENEQTKNWEEIRQKVLERDDYCCQFCGLTEEEHSEKHGRGLSIHHVIPERDGGTNNMNNLVALCRSCHRTMEAVHGRTMGLIAREEDHRGDLEGVNKVIRKHNELADQLEDELHQFAEDHPIFAREFGVNKTPHELNVFDWRESANSHSAPKIESEWQFAVSWGYKEGIFEVLAALDGLTDAPFEQVDDA